MSQYDGIASDSARPGFVRFTSLDSQFPIAISVPEPLRYNLFYDMSFKSNLMLKSGMYLIVSREDLQLLAERRDRAAQSVIEGSKDMVGYMEEWFKWSTRQGHISAATYKLSKHERELVTVGSGAESFQAHNIIWQTGTGAEGLKVFFTRRSSDIVSSHPSGYLLWTITLDPDYVLRTQWQTILSSFQWLD